MVTFVIIEECLPDSRTCRVSINLDSIVYVRPTYPGEQGYTNIKLLDGNSIKTMVTAPEVIKLINEAQKCIQMFA
jgi:hypothetical protein